MTMTMTLKNNYHNTETVVTPELLHGRLWLSATQVRQARAALCGHADCTCGDALGCRGPQDLDFEPLPDGGAVATPPQEA